MAADADAHKMQGDHVACLLGMLLEMMFKDLMLSAQIDDHPGTAQHLALRRAA